MRRIAVINRRYILIALFSVALLSIASLAWAKQAPAKKPSAQGSSSILPIRVLDLPDNWLVEDAAWDDAGDRAYVGYSVVALNIWALISQAWPEVFLVVLGLPLLWQLRKTWQRKQVVGEPHCRKCNYQLTHQESQRCPECGTDLLKHKPVRGRQRRQRLALMLGGLVLLGASYNWCLHNRPRYGPWCDWFGWWSTKLDFISALNSQFEWLDRSSRVVSRVDMLGLPAFSGSDVPDSPSDRDLYTAVGGDLIDHISVSPRGDRLIFMHASTVTLMDAHTGKIISHVTGMGNTTSGRFDPGPCAAILSADGKFIYLLGQMTGITAFDAESGKQVFRDVSTYTMERDNLSLGVTNLRTVQNGNGVSSRYFTVLSQDSDTASTCYVTLFRQSGDDPPKEIAQAEADDTSIVQAIWLPADQMSTAARARYNSVDKSHAELNGAFIINRSIKGITEWVLRQGAPLTPFIKSRDLVCDLSGSNSILRIDQPVQSTQDSLYVSRYAITHDGDLLFAACMDRDHHDASIQIIDVPGSRRLPIVLQTPDSTEDSDLNGYEIETWHKLAVSSDDRYLYAWADAANISDMMKLSKLSRVVTLTSPQISSVPFQPIITPGSLPAPSTPLPSLPAIPSTTQTPTQTSPVPSVTSSTGPTISAASSIHLRTHTVLCVFDLDAVRKSMATDQVISPTKH